MLAGLKPTFSSVSPCVMLGDQTFWAFLRGRRQVRSSSPRDIDEKVAERPAEPGLTTRGRLRPLLLGLDVPSLPGDLQLQLLSEARRPLCHRDPHSSGQVLRLQQRQGVSGEVSLTLEAARGCLVSG